VAVTCDADALTRSCANGAWLENGACLENSTYHSCTRDLTYGHTTVCMQMRLDDDDDEIAYFTVR